MSFETQKRYWQRGEPLVWVTAAALAASLIMIAALIGVIAWKGLGMFWPERLTLLRLDDGTALLGAVRASEPVPGRRPPTSRLQLKIGNRDLYGLDFRWVEQNRVVSSEGPADAVAIQRSEYGDLYGFLAEVRREGETVARGREAVWEMLQPLLKEAERRSGRIHALESDIGSVNNALEDLRLDSRRLEMRGGGLESEASAARRRAIEQRRTDLEARYAQVHAELDAVLLDASRETLVVETADGRLKEVPLPSVLRVRFPNSMGLASRMGAYAGALWEFVTGEPRESNTEGGVFPALFGTVLMVLMMTLIVVPLGVLAALYLREYAQQGWMVGAVRIAVNNLAGVPSIVFGVFGLAFFIYTVGGTLDRLFYPEVLPTPTYGTGGLLWASLTLALLTVPVVIVATEEALAAVPREYREGGLALGATRWQVIRRIILPAASPGILTGMILAMARGAGEVAPLMLTGVVKLAPELPLDGEFPFLHLERKFMHLGFHVYDVGFQSPNVEASKPMVYATALLMITLVLLLNLTAILIRNRVRRRLGGRPS